MSTLGNSDAVRKGNAREEANHPSRRRPARETAEKRTVETPEEPREAPKPKPEVDEFAEDLRRAIPGIPDNTIEDLRREFRR